MSAGEVEMLLRDPYAVYARRVLRLRPLDALDADPGAAERGQIVHAALERFVRANPNRLPPDALGRLIEEARLLFDQPDASPVVAAFWRPRFARAARWFIEAFEAEARQHGAPVALAALGMWAADGRVTLTAKVDRIDRRFDDTLALYDYTTGRAPSADEAKAAYSPRLLLAGLVAEAGGFPGVPAALVGALDHVVLRGGDPPGAVEPVEDVGANLRRAEAGLKRLLARFADPATPYAAGGSSGWPGPYDHLARHGEWDLPGDGGDQV
jgi:ATP-dependent helicase/nuclease subunit B